MALSYASLRKTDPSTPCSVPHSLSRALGVEEVLEAGPLSGQSHCWVVTSSLGYLGTLATALRLLEPQRDEDKEGQGLASLQLVTEASTLLFQKPEKPRNCQTPNPHISGPSFQLSAVWNGHYMPFNLSRRDTSGRYRERTLRLVIASHLWPAL